ncbi:hypothetical protein [Arcicella lustrica]|uniref:Carboxypeptidase regulatory-like domain-containing protein n=1 Tax=Arcicella lustrica TaxID=2984196 RepID=A0ABU5SHS8_9BACT|nr:hypothetical protein [Arcicella sp. DC25W]MEA5426845.1 hypothetical protein [Arcicella sp. DC25W]
MKRRKFLGVLGVLPPILFSCGKDEFPDRPTIITGKVIDENNMPVVGLKFQFSGYYLKGLSPIPTFDATEETNKDGIYTISYIVTNGQTEFLPESNTNYDLMTKYNIYVWENNQYEQVGNPVGPIIYGETNTFNFQLRKR